MIGRVSGFEHDRTSLLEEVRRESHRAVATYDHQEESRRLAGAVREAVAGGALLQVGALGLGTAVAILATTTAADVTGLLAAGTLSVVGFLLLPARRRQARRELQERVASMRATLLARLTEAFDREIARSLQRLAEALSPYTRFVRAEREKGEAERRDIDRLQTEIAVLKTRLD
jgi:hypothetical protein